MKSPLPTSEFSARRHGYGLWAVAFAFTAVMAFSTVPTPLYPIYQARDGFSTFIVTIIFAAYAVGVVVSLLLAGHVSDWIGRRRALLPAVLLSFLSAVVFLLWRELPGLLVARVLSGLSVGVVTATATAYLVELHLGQRPGSSPRRAQIVSTTANLGGFALGPLIAGLLAEYVTSPLTVPFLLFGGLLGLAAISLVAVPETVERPEPRPRYRPQRVAVPDESRREFFGAAVTALVTFAALGLFAALGPSFMANTLHQSSPLLAAVPASAAFAAAVVAQLAAVGWGPRRLLATGLPTLALGMALVLAATWLSDLPLFLVGGTIAGAGGGLCFKGGLATVATMTAPGRQAETVAGFFLAGYTGISIPVIGVGILVQFLAAKVALAIFVALVLLGIAYSVRALLARPGQATGDAVGAGSGPEGHARLRSGLRRT